MLDHFWGQLPQSRQKPVDPVQASQAQIDHFIADLSEGDTNNRPVQPTYGRVTLKGK